MNRNGVLLFLAFSIASQVPTTIERVQPAELKAMLQLLALLVLVFLAMKIDPRRGFSDPPPPPPRRPDSDPVTIPDTNRRH